MAIRNRRQSKNYSTRENINRPFFSESLEARQLMDASGVLLAPLSDATAVHAPTAAVAIQPRQEVDFRNNVGQSADDRDDASISRLTEFVLVIPTELCQLAEKTNASPIPLSSNRDLFVQDQAIHLLIQQEPQIDFTVLHVGGEEQVELPPEFVELSNQLGEEMFAEWLRQNLETWGNCQGICGTAILEMERLGLGDEFRQTEALLCDWLESFEQADDSSTRASRAWRTQRQVK